MPPVPPPLDPIDSPEVLDAIERVEAHLIDLLETLTAGVAVYGGGRGASGRARDRSRG